MEMQEREDVKEISAKEDVEVVLRWTGVQVFLEKEDVKADFRMGKEPLMHATAKEDAAPASWTFLAVVKVAVEKASSNFTVGKGVAKLAMATEKAVADLAS